MKIIYSAVFIVFLFACKNNNQSATARQEEKKTDTIITDTIINKETNIQTQNKADTTVSRLVITFYSIGSGSEYALCKELEDSIESYSLKVGKTIDYKKTSWGREGEIDVCLKLNELSQEEREDFVVHTKTMLKKGKWVNIYDNKPCPIRMVRK